MAVRPEHSPETIPPIDTEPTNTPDKFSYRNATFEEVLEDLSSRFILNLPEDELAEVERVCFQVEQAHWYYEDFIRDENPSFPSLPLKKFSEILFRSCPLLHHWSHDHETAFNGFMSYKTRVPVCGAIMLNESLTKCVLVKGWKSSAGWSFPKGKVNENEDEAFCAVREVLEETGYSLSGKIRRTDCIRLCIKQQPITLFVVPGVPEDFPFKTQTRKEISKIDWFKLADLPNWKKTPSNTNKFYLITPVIRPLKSIVRTLRKTRISATSECPSVEVAQTMSHLQTGVPADVDNELTGIPAVESPGTEHDPSPHCQSGDAEISSSQSSSIDPHTPSVSGDLAPQTSDDSLVVNHTYSRDINDIATEADMGFPLGALTSISNDDYRTHWSRLMTRLNHSEESSPRGTPKASTRTPPIVPDLAPPESHPLIGSSSPQGRAVTGDALVGRSNLEQSDILSPHRSSRRHPNVARALSLSSLPRGSESLGVPTSSPSVTHPPLSLSLDRAPSSPDVIVKRTRQLQLLDSVIAEESTRRTPQPTPPMSAHILGAYPQLVPAQVDPVRPASANPESSRTLSTPCHQHKLSVPSLSGVLPSPASTAQQHQPIRVPQGPILQHRPYKLTHSRGKVPTMSELPLQLPLALQAHQGSNLSGLPLTAPHYAGDTSVDSTHRGQMLSILTGGSSAFWSSAPRTTGAGVRSNSAVHHPGIASSPGSNGSFSSTSTITSHPLASAPRRASGHLLSILNNSSPAGRSSPTTRVDAR